MAEHFKTWAVGLHAAEFAVKLERIAQSPQWKNITGYNFCFMFVFSFLSLNYRYIRNNKKEDGVEEGRSEENELSGQLPQQELQGIPQCCCF